MLAIRRAAEGTDFKSANASVRRVDTYLRTTTDTPGRCTDMIDLYYWTTPNGHKITMFLEEAGVPYTLHGIDINKGDQFADAFTKIAPNNRIPAIVDNQPADSGGPLSIFESGAILLYLAEKTGALLPTDPRKRAMALEWLFWQVGGLGPMAGQNHHFKQYAKEKLPYAIDRYVNETNRLYGVLDGHLQHHEFCADTYSIADIAAYPWIVPYKKQGQDLDEFPNLKRWFEAIASMPSTKRAYEAADRLNKKPVVDDASHKILFGQRARRAG